MPIHRLRRRLRMIRYYSAPRRTTPMGRITDGILLAALLGAGPLAWFLDGFFHTGIAQESLSGSVFQTREGTVWAMLSERDASLRVRDTRSHFRAAFKIGVQSRSQGWPFTSTVIRQPAAVEIDETRTVSLEGSPLREPIEEALREAGRGDVVSLLAAGAVPEVRRRSGALLANAILLAIVMPLAAWVCMAPLRVAALVGRSRRFARRADRRGRGFCEACGYDLRGRRLAARCPECGAAV